MAYFTRTQWGARAPEARYDFGGTDVEGIALHWPAMSKPVRGFRAVAAALRGWQDYHMDDLGWSDLGYQEAVDQDGNAYELRGLDHRSGANGDADLNHRFGALLLVLAPGEEPTAAMLRTARSRIAEHRRLHRSSRRIVGHSDIRPEPTACPGRIARRLIAAGAFDPTTTREDWLTMETKEEVREVVREELHAVLHGALRNDGTRRVLDLGEARIEHPTGAETALTLGRILWAIRADLDALCEEGGEDRATQ